MCQVWLKAFQWKTALREMIENGIQTPFALCHLSAMCSQGMLSSLTPEIIFSI